MNPETEKKLLTLAREIKELDKTIVKERAEKGKESSNLRKRFFEVEEEIKKILAEETPLDDIRDSAARDTLRKVRSGNYFQLDKEAKKIENFIKKLPPQIVEDFFKSKGIIISEEEIDDEIARVTTQFQEEIIEKIDPGEYFERKKEFSTIIADSRIHEKIRDYFLEIRECFLFGQMYAVLGLCRVMLELAFKDKFDKLGLAKKFESPKVASIEERKTYEIISLVCKRLGAKSIEIEARDLWKTSSQILHGRKTNIKLEQTEVLNFVRKTFGTIEKLYRS